LFARNYAKIGMLAYVQGIQRQERSNDVETLQHQTWSGANYVDSLSMYFLNIDKTKNKSYFINLYYFILITVKVVQGGVSSTAAMGKGVTEQQFSK
jgi:isocitrate lyase